MIKSLITDAKINNGTAMENDYLRIVPSSHNGVFITMKLEVLSFSKATGTVY